MSKQVMDKEEIKYDAFISYKHSERDSYIAESIHKQLEHYHIPKSVQQMTGKKKIERVIRDREDMVISNFMCP
jgi:hypothetical protein